MTQRLVRASLLVLAVALVSIAILSWYRDRHAEVHVSDRVVQLSAQVQKERVTVTAQNLAEEPVVVEHCTHYTRLSGGVLQPAYSPCLPQMIAIAPGQSVTDQIPVERWNRDEPVQVTIQYQFRNQSYTLSLPIPPP